MVSIMTVVAAFAANPDAGTLALEPSLHPAFARAVHWPDIRTVSNPLAVTRAYATRFVALGGMLLNGDARSLHRIDGRWRVDAAIELKRQPMTGAGEQIYEGGCHCGRVRFRVTASLSGVTYCNCSMCAKKGFLHLIVPPEKFELLSGKDALTKYKAAENKMKGTVHVMGMAIDVHERRPWIGNVQGGLSGPAIKPIALLKVHQVHEVAAPHRIPIIGQGGIVSAHDALEFIIAGATAVGVGTALFYDPFACKSINEGITAHLREQGLGNVTELVGTLRTTQDIDCAVSG